MAEPNFSIRSPKQEFHIQGDHWNHTTILDEWECIWGAGDEAWWDFMPSEESPEDIAHEGDAEVKMESFCEVDDVDITTQGECTGFLDVKNGVSLNLSLNYEEIMDAWPRGVPLWTENCSISSGNMAGEEPLDEERERRRARVLKYREKRQSRLFSNKIRYQVRKLNAEKRPRLKGRFVKRCPDD